MILHACMYVCVCVLLCRRIMFGIIFIVPFEWYKLSNLFLFFYSFEAYFKLKWTYTLLVYGLNFSFAVVARYFCLCVCVCVSLVCICDVRIFFAGYSNNYEQVLGALSAIRYMQRVSGCCEMEYQNKKKRVKNGKKILKSRFGELLLPRRRAI